MDARLSRCGVTTTEKVEVVQLVIEVVQGLAGFKSIIKWILLIIGVVKGRIESAKHVGEGKISFPVTVIGGRVKNEWPSVGIITCVSTPEITVEQGWMRLITGEKEIDAGEQFFRTLKLSAFLSGQIKLMGKPVITVKRYPVI